MAGSFKKGAIPPDPRVVIPKLEDYIDVSSLAGGLPAAPGIIDRESKVKAWPMYANGPDAAAPPAISSTGVGGGIEQKINQAWAETNIGQAIGLITEDWIAKNGTSINGQSLQQLITDSKNVRG
jgi:hypothetical protein